MINQQPSQALYQHPARFNFLMQTLIHSQIFFETCEGLSMEYDSTDSGKVIRSRFVPMEVSCLCTKNLSGQSVQMAE